MALEEMNIPGDYLPPEGTTTVLEVELHMKVYSDGTVAIGDRTIRYESLLSPGIINLLTMSTISIGKDALLHRRWNTMQNPPKKEETPAVLDKKLRKNLIKRAAAKVKKGKR